MPPGEGTKSFAGLEQLCGELLDLGVDRGGLIVALGGGVIGDLTGFAAGVLKRGVDFAQIPTTLLAQVDSSVGGKTAINAPQGKNLIGLFHQPRIVIADTALLATLPRRELLAGYAEVVKYGALGDAQFFAWLEQNGAAALAGDRHAIDPCRGPFLPDEGRHRRARRTRNRRARLAQSRPHIRPCPGSGDRIFRPPAPWRRRRHRHGAGLPAFGAAGPLPRRRTPSGSPGI